MRAGVEEDGGEGRGFGVQHPGALQDELAHLQAELGADHEPDNRRLVGGVQHADAAGTLAFVSEFGSYGMVAAT